MSDMDQLVDDFLRRYQREFDYYNGVCSVASELLDAKLQAIGVRAIVSSRAKNPKRLKAKIIQRSVQSNYEAVEDIYNDLFDLAGVRVALYFPAQMDEVEYLIEENFVVEKKLSFPRKAEGERKVQQESYEKKFSGYHARHYRVYLNSDKVSESDSRFLDARIEIQVASVLMHAWSEVEHDLVYKPLQGELSRDELLVLDQLNGLVLSGEMSLELLQKAGELRLAKGGVVFRNHYELAASLLEFVRERRGSSDITEKNVGNIEFLFRVLKGEQLNTFDYVKEFFDKIDENFDSISLSEQIVNKMLEEQPSRFNKYYEALKKQDAYDPIPREGSSSNVLEKTVILDFIHKWADFERAAESISIKLGLHPNVYSVKFMKMLEGDGGLEKSDVDRLLALRDVRNGIVHGKFSVDQNLLKEGIKDLNSIIEKLNAIN
ncbi:RelA/SpoT domain-containing protein [Chromobacterium violaceum]|uniref:hypothetical protein n=1 Tax=Chromobacterium violaceum TaxID=536 RepID=UPI00385E111C